MHHLFHCLALPLAAWFFLTAPLSATDLDAPPPGAFTVVVIPDTQGYLGAGTKLTPGSTDSVSNPVLANHVRWITENVGSQNIVFVTHVGDIVDRNVEAQWQVARQHLDTLREVVPFGLVVGNHDMKANGDATLFQRHFPADRFAEFSWYGGSYEPRGPDDIPYGNNVNSYQLFSAGGMDFVILHLECNAPDEVLHWAAEVLTRHSTRRAFVSTHMDLGVLDHPKTEEGFITDPKGRMRWSKIHGEKGNTAVQMWEKLFRRHANIGFIFSGDQSRVTALRLAEPGDNGNIVHSLLSDYMSEGPLRLYRFIPAENKVQIITYDTTKHQLVESMIYVPDRDQHQFTLDYMMTPAAGRTIQVPGDHPTIQAAIDAAHDGDTVLVGPGLYQEQLKLAGKSLTLASTFLTSKDPAHIAATILDGQGRNKAAGPVITVDKTAGPETKIIGFTIQNGGHGIANYGKIQVLNNRFTGNGDALSFESGSAVVRENVFEANRDDGIDIDGASEALIEDNIIRNNHDDGIEIRLHQYSGPVLNIVIRRNIIAGNLEDGLQLIDYPDHSDRAFRIERNLFAHNAMAAIGSMQRGNTRENYEGADMPEPVVIVNNTFVGGPYGITGGDNMVVLNNIFTGITKTALKRVHGDSAAGPNLFWNNPVDLEDCDLTSDAFVRSDPRLDEQHRPTTGSPAIDAGLAAFSYNGATLDLPPGTYTGVAPDLGAYETAP